jgi:hypothetical protein
MEQRKHPATQRALREGFLIAWLSAFACFSFALYLLKHGHEASGWTFAGLFGVTIVSGISFAFWRLHRVWCPQCGGRAPTVKDEPGNWWFAKCERCKILCDLKTQVD